MYLIQHLAGLGVNFDCASPAEMELVLKQGVAPASIIFANPCKAKSAIRFARKQGVLKTTFDNTAELVKIAREYPEAQLILRILADDETATTRLGEKFGASVLESVALLDYAKRLDLNVVGVSFHVGSGAKNVLAFKQAIRDAHHVWVYAQDLGFKMLILDIGGGFCQDSMISMAPAINSFLEFYFGHIPCRIIAEPGRYFAEGAYTLACSVIAARSTCDEDLTGASPQRLYLNDGVYGSFGNCIYEKAQYCPRILQKAGEYFPRNGKDLECGEECSIWGPTCDSADCINRSCTLKVVPGVGDWLYFENMGAYSLACLTRFNGFSNVRQTIYLPTDKKWGRKGSESSFEDEGFSTT